MKITKKSITLLLAGLLCASNSFSQTYPKQDGVIRLLTYNTHYCKGGTDPGSLNDLNTKRFANILKALDADVVALQELDSAANGRWKRVLLDDIAKWSELDYVQVYGIAADYDGGSVGNGTLVKRWLPIKKIKKMKSVSDLWEPCLTFCLRAFTMKSKTGQKGKDAMKWMIASDLHGSYFYASQMQQAFEREQADRLLLLGDLLYHGPRNDLPEGYAPKQVMPLLNGMKDRLLCVRGNCDAEVDQMVLEFPVLADYAVLPVGRRLVYATHGHVYNTKTPPPLAPGDILLHGHTHIPAWEPFGQGSLYLNPGSVSLPKEGSAHSYMTLENGCFRWKTMDGRTYHELTLSET